MAKDTLPLSFIRKKAKILQDLAVPTESYDDLSPKGSVDEGIRGLIDEINGMEGFVTTSSCAGRVSVFLEGKRKNAESETVGDSEDGDGFEARDLGGDGEEDLAERAGEGRESAPESSGESVTETRAGVGGKGGGGRWLFVSHERITLPEVDATSDTQEYRRKNLALVGKLGMEFSDRQYDPEFNPGRRNIHFKFEPLVRLFSLQNA
jgi:tRNA wybutosine-synthesizing protein 3